MANARSATEPIIDMLVDDVLARFPRTLARLGEGFLVAPDGGTSIW